MSKDLAASVRARLLNLAKAERSDFTGVLVRYALERLLYRLSLSSHGGSFLLKGALLFTLWCDEFANDPTRQALWRAFLKKNEVDAGSLPSVVAILGSSLQPVLRQAWQLRSIALGGPDVGNARDSPTP